jgi:Ca2+-binding EF-hand superfamily protein
MLNSLYCYNDIRIIKKPNNRKLFVKYLINVFHNIALNDLEAEKKVIDKLAFLEYIGMPYFVSEKIYKLISPNDDSIDLETFVGGMKKLYNSGLDESIKAIFNLLDFDSDGYIIPEDVRLLVSFTVSKSNHSIVELDSIINEFFTSNKLDYKTFKDKVSSSNSDVYFVLYYYIIENSPFNEHNLEIYKYCNEIYQHKLKNRSDSALEMNSSYIDISTRSGPSSKDEPNYLRLPSKKLSQFYKDNIGQIEIFENDDEIMLKELEEFEPHIKIQRFITKGIMFIEEDETRFQIHHAVRSIYNNYSIFI